MRKIDLFRAARRRWFRQSYQLRRARWQRDAWEQRMATWRLRRNAALLRIDLNRGGAHCAVPVNCENSEIGQLIDRLYQLNAHVPPLYPFDARAIYSFTARPTGGMMDQGN
jgi:hypothetical protein